MKPKYRPMAEVLAVIIREEAYLKGKGSWELSDAMWYERTAAVQALKWAVGLSGKNPEEYPFG